MEHPGDVFYWAASVVAGLITLWVVWSYVFNADKGEPIVQIVPLLLAGAIWLLARLGRHSVG
jgi:hypothetical protein